MQDLKIQILQSYLLLVPFYTTRFLPRTYNLITVYSLKTCLFNQSTFFKRYLSPDMYLMFFTKSFITFYNVFAKPKRPIGLVEYVRIC
jgi:hypothetical protein